MAIRGGGLTLPSSKVQASVTASYGDPSAVEQLVEVKVLLFGVAPPFRNPERLLLGTRELGRPIAVDEESLEKPLEPIRLYLGCRSPVSLPPFIMLFINMQGYKVRVVLESDLPGSAAPLPPPKPSEDKEDDLEDSDEEEWDGRRGKHDKKKEKKDQPAPMEGKSSGSKVKMMSLELVAVSQASPLHSAIIETIPPSALNQYGSNLTAAGDIFPAIAKIITPGKFPASPGVLAAADEGEPSAVEISFSADDGFTSGGSAPTQGKAKRLSAQEREEIGWESPSSWEATPAAMLDRERRSKSYADHPSLKCNPVLQDVAVQLDFSGDSEAVKASSPLAVGAVVPALAAKVSRAPRSKADSVEAARKSARGQGLTEGSVLDRAIRRSAEKDAGTSSKSIHDFSILSKPSDSHLLEVAADCAVLFPADLGDPVQILSIL
jgi:hypothetical protein